MNRSLTLALLAAALTPLLAGADAAPRRLSREALRDKIKGAWAGQMIGVSYGAKTEFRAKGVRYETEIKPEPLSNAIQQDDLYVEMTFARVLDTVGLDATSVDFGAAFKDSRYQLWHANAAARRNLARGIAPPLSGHPRFNAHADDIDFQIEADFIGIMCPGLPQASNQIADRVGRVMNHGDGLYGGMFVAGMYAAGFFETDPRAVVAAGLACIPPGSSYARLVSDVMTWSQQHPEDWRVVWGLIQEKWDVDDPCPDGALNPFNIDAKLNGAYIALGMIYGRGDWERTMEVSTRCGQDSDCNPSSAAGVLGAMLGYAKLPESYRRELAAIADTKFQFTDYSFNEIVQSTERRALAVIQRAGGKVTETEVIIPRQAPHAPALEQCNFGKPVKLVEVGAAEWTWRGTWRIEKDRRTEKDHRITDGAGSEAELRFNGTGVALVGPMSPQGGRADVFIDGRKLELVADAHVGPAIHDNDLWRVFDLAQGEHTLRLVTRADADPQSKGKAISLRHAVIYGDRLAGSTGRMTMANGGTPPPAAPTSLALNTASVAENQPPGTAVGTFTATDPNPGDTHTFTLVSGAGGADNASFTIAGAVLKTAAAFDFETRSAYSIRVRATDQGGLYLEQAFTVSVDNLNDVDLRTVVPPNIIIFMADDMGMGDAHPYFGKKLGSNAAPVATTQVTPNLDRLAGMGTLFTDVHTGSSMCSPTRYALLTGRYAWRSYNKHNVIGGWNSRPMIAPNRPTLATALKQCGYRTAAFGKWHLGWTFLTKTGGTMAYDSVTSSTWATVPVGTNANGSYVTNILDGPLAHGFDYFFGVSGNLGSGRAHLLKCYIENNAIQGIPTWGERGGPSVADWDPQRTGERYLNTALGYIDTHVAQGSNAPFFFYYVPNANHAPYDPPTSIVVQGQTIPIKGQSRLTDGSAGGSREDMIYENNIAVGLLLDKLAKVNDPRTGRPMINSTIFIFTSDNGPNVSGVAQAGLRDKKQAIYEGGHRVPFMVSWPDGGIPGGAVSTANFGLFDLYASFSALLGHKLGVDEAEDSENVLPALLNQVPGTQFRRPHLLVSHDNSLGSNDLPDDSPDDSLLAIRPSPAPRIKRNTGNDLPGDSLLAIRQHPFVMISDGKLVNRRQTSGANYGTTVPLKLFDLDADLHQDTTLLADPAQQALVSQLKEQLLLFNNRGYSRELGLTDYNQVLLSDGGADLRNDRTGAIGYEFTTGDQPVVVESLGLWDDAAVDVTGNELATKGDGQTAGVPDGLHTAHVVRLFDGISQQLIASITVNSANSYLVGEFRYVNLPQPIMLDKRKTYALTQSTASGDGDLFHHFASITGVSPSPTSLVSNFVARVAATAGAYPGQYPDGPDGVGNRHPDMFRHRMFVGPNARLAPVRVVKEN
jgi:arylsulfatase A-like enzyme